jgi:hypothetical protein
MFQEYKEVCDDARNEMKTDPSIIGSFGSHVACVIPSMGKVLYSYFHYNLSCIMTGDVDTQNKVMDIFQKHNLLNESVWRLSTDSCAMMRNNIVRDMCRELDHHANQFNNDQVARAEGFIGYVVNMVDLGSVEKYRKHCLIKRYGDSVVFDTNEHMIAYLKSEQASISHPEVICCDLLRTVDANNTASFLSASGNSSIHINPHPLQHRIIDYFYAMKYDT